ncbi:MAG: hypothetical protein DIU52_013900 [bacterium]
MARGLERVLPLPGLVLIVLGAVLGSGSAIVPAPTLRLRRWRWPRRRIPASGCG